MWLFILVYVVGLGTIGFSFYAGAQMVPPASYGMYAIGVFIVYRLISLTIKLYKLRDKEK